MTLLDRDRKILWGRAANRCALCRQELVKDETGVDSAAVVGDEAHIVARSPGGARYRELPSADLDSYDNLILLCKVDHKRVDDQPSMFNEETLLKKKREHETWVKTVLGRPDVSPIRVRAIPTSTPMMLCHLTRGDQVWDIIANSQAFHLNAPDDCELDEEAAGVADEFLDLARDYGDISDAVIERGFSAVREAKRQFGEHVEQLGQHGLVVFGGREHKVIEGGHLPPAPFVVATIVVLPVLKAIEYAKQSDDAPLPEKEGDTD